MKLSGFLLICVLWVTSSTRFSRVRTVRSSCCGTSLRHHFSPTALHAKSPFPEFPRYPPKPSRDIARILDGPMGEQERQARFKMFVSKALKSEGALLLFPSKVATVDRALMNRIRAHNSVEARFASVLHMLDGTLFAGSAMYAGMDEKYVFVFVVTSDPKMRDDEVDWFRNHHNKLVRKCNEEEALDEEPLGVVICNPPFVLHLPLYAQDVEEVLHEAVGEEEDLVGFEDADGQNADTY